MRDTDYAYCVARLRAAESRLLSDEDFEALVSAKTYFEAVKYLIEKGYAQKNMGLTQIISFQNRELWDMLSSSVPDKKELDALCILNDFFNIKAAIKCFFTDDDAEDYFIYPTTVDLERLVQGVKENDFSSLSGLKGESAKEAYETVCRTSNGQNGEIIIDKATVTALRRYAERKKSGLAGEVCALLCDTANIKIALRCQRAGKGRDFVESALSQSVYLDSDKLIRYSLKDDESLTEYLKATRYSKAVELYEINSGEFDRWCDDETVRICSKAKFTCFGFDPVCSYYYSRLREIKRVRIILSCKLSGVPQKLIRERTGL